MTKLTFLKLNILALFLLFFVGVKANHTYELKKLEERLAQANDPNEKINALYELSKLIVHSDAEQAVDYSKEALQLAKEVSNQKMLAKIQSLLGKLYQEAGKKELALEALEISKKIAVQERFRELEADSYIKLGYYWYRLGDSTKTIFNYQKGFDLYQKLKDNNGIAKSYLKLGWGYYMFGNYDASEHSFQKALEMEPLIINDNDLVINILFGVGSFYVNQSIKQHQSIQYFERALKLAEMEGDEFSIGRAYNALGLLYSSLDKNKIAESFYQKGLKIFEKLGNKAEVTWLYTQTGELYAGNQQYEKALEYFEQALKIAEEIDISTLSKSTIYMAIGSVHKERGDDLEKAIGFFKESLELAKGIKNNYQILNSKLNIGKCYVAMDNFSEGEKWCRSVYDKLSGHFLLSQGACECLYKALNGKKDYQNALFYFEKFKIYSDSLHKEELSESINTLAAKQAFEMELAELQKNQETEAANSRVRNIIWISVISFFALMIIMYLILSNIKKTAQRKQLETISRVRQEMIANVSHDLRTPIMVMTGYAETLLMKLGKIELKDQERYLNIILDSANRLSNLIKQLFEYSKLEAQQLQPIKDSFQLAKLVKDTFARYQIIAKNKNVEIKIDCAENIPMVYADISLIDRVIQNLMDNALKFTPQNGVISICLYNQDDQVQVKISDTGKGIPDEKINMIFNRYEKSTSSNGAGLGLTIVKKILEMHDSKIQVNSKVNEGTTFAFSLPIAS